MDATLLLAPLVLATDFVAATLTKLANRKGSRQTMTIFGLPATLLVALFTNVLEGEFPEVRLITFNTKITHLRDVPKRTSCYCATVSTSGVGSQLCN